MTNLVNLFMTPLTALMGIDIFPLVLGSCLILAFVICLIEFIFKAVF